MAEKHEHVSGTVRTENQVFLRSKQLLSYTAWSPMDGGLGSPAGLKNQVARAHAKETGEVN